MAAHANGTQKGRQRGRASATRARKLDLTHISRFDHRIASARRCRGSTGRSSWEEAATLLELQRWTLARLCLQKCEHKSSAMSSRLIGLLGRCAGSKCTPHR